ncbi:MAG TPA: hypothetical protein VNM67_23760 [Thermoanaerobaculia bacterium]|jgi:hypothetical protein|nr:hypothetical protein [Thermoanaerobaculia bacterium]
MRASISPRYTPEEFARRGDEIYERDVLPQLADGTEGMMVAIDIETGAFEVDEDELAAAHRLLDRHDDAQIWFRQIGTSYTHRMGLLPIRKVQ